MTRTCCCSVWQWKGLQNGFKARRELVHFTCRCGEQGNRMMSKEEDNAKFLKIQVLLRLQTCTLKVNIHCDGCKKKVKKLLHKVDGVYTTSIDAEEGKVTVSGNVDPAALLKKLAKAGKHAELLAPKACNNDQKPQLQLQKQDGKGGGNGIIDGGGGKDPKLQQSKPIPQQQQQQQQLQQQLFQQHLQQLQKVKAANNVLMPPMKLLNLPPQKSLKSVNFEFPPKGFQGYDDDDEDDFEEEDDLDENDMDEFDCFDVDFDEEFRNIKIKPAISTPKAKAEKGDQVPPVHSRAVCNNVGRKNGKKDAGSATTSGGGARPQDIKNNGNFNKATHNGEAAGKLNGDVHDVNLAKKMQGKNGIGGVCHPMVNPSMVGHGFPAGKMQVPVGHVGNIPAAHGAGAAPGFYQGGGALVPPAEVIAAVNPYQQQYMAAMIQQQQQQQRMMMMMQDRPAFQPTMAYSRAPPVTMYNMYMPPPPAPHSSEPYTTFFSDENAGSGCSIM
ncbi:hypothetical protein ZIOFF_069542 [Zingiber officinale]|uniref:HMA domain-containing protein n=1 Tax=Zingiber officinale TaxID=94328 RepID=A0A8J5ECT9_ZINOF|nr:hypothetical protein ZIOFF_069542 [Zingiber officinale]